jgi:hypothetical protein
MKSLDFLFNLLNIPSRAMSKGLIQPLTETRTSNIPWALSAAARKEFYFSSSNNIKKKLNSMV